MNNLLGRKDIEEARMAISETLNVTNRVDDKVDKVDDKVNKVDDKVTVLIDGG